MKSMNDILRAYAVDVDKQRRISREWQDYGYRLALELEDLKHKALYIKLAKQEPRALLEEARLFVKSASKAKNKGGLFMWKLKQIKEQRKKDSKQDS